MPITVLSQETINQIAAGEVIERPSSVVKELLENAIDAGSTAVTVEIKEGGISFIRITDNGCGIPAEEIHLAFQRHATSKITSVEDLLTVSSLGFRGEALSSIAAVARVELITRTESSLTGVRYCIDGGVEQKKEEIGAPAGTTFLVRNLFYNTPARRKFLKTAQTEGNYIIALVERMALSHPEVSLRLMVNGQNKLHTAGNHKLKDIIYTVYGREITKELLPVKADTELVHLEGYIGKPLVSRGNRTYENYYINGRYIKSALITRAIEDAYHGFVMQHKYPFTVLHLSIAPACLDVNVHPTKMELRFREEEKIYQAVFETLRAVICGKELIPQVTVGKEEKAEKEEKPPLSGSREHGPEPFERRRQESLYQEPQPQNHSGGHYGSQVREKTVYEPSTYDRLRQESGGSITTPAPHTEEALPAQERMENFRMQDADLFEEKILSPQARANFRLIGQLFDTYWLVQYQDKFLMIDQHAAHEKVLYERTIKTLATREHTCQQLNPPIILTLNAREEQVLNEHREEFQSLGFELEPFGGKEYAVYGVPDNLFSIAKQELLMEMIDSLADENGRERRQLIEEKVALMSCKAAVKGNNRLSALEAEALIDELLQLENPYSCPHGRPTIIAMTQYELEKKFKRVVS